MSSGPGAESSIAELISDRSHDMPAGERRAAQTLIAHYPIAGLKTVAEFAAQAGVSSPTILRFVSRLGMANYSEFQARLQDELAAQLQSPLSRSTRSRRSPASDFVDAVTTNLQETFRHFGQKQIDEIAALIAASNGRVYLAGGRFTDPLARYL
ncbi:MurR/RpiR family transcriptional regulator, partial [Salmonella enterica subsp. enterica]|nr:MurR/RpiR family transcriptional regulator [Salmonella enterica subsp. enterica]